MPRSTNSLQASALGGANYRKEARTGQFATAQWRYHGSFSCEFDQPNAAHPCGASTLRSRGADELGALLDRALAFAG